MHFETLCAVLPHDAFTAIEAALKKGVEAKNLLKAADVSVSLGEFFGPPSLSSLVSRLVALGACHIKISPSGSCGIVRGLTA